MKCNIPSSLAALAAATFGLFLAGCASERITADYTMPAREIADVGAVNLLDIVSVAKLSGNRVVEGDSERAASLVRRDLSSRLYQEGFYQTVDSIWGPDAKGVASLGKYSNFRASRHGYASFASLADDATGRLEITLKLGVNASRRQRNEEITLTSVPYVMDERKDEFTVPSSRPAKSAEWTKQTVSVNYDVWQVSGEGTLQAKLFETKTGKIVYERSFQIAAPDDDSRCEPTLLRAVAAAIDPAIKEIIADISPHQERRSLDVNPDSHPRVAAFLAAKDFVDTVLEVDRLENDWVTLGKKAPDPYEPTFADFANKAVALEALGQYAEAKMAWEKVRQMEPGYAPAVARVKRIESVLAGKQAIKDSGARKSGDTEYKKDAVSKQAL